MVVPKININQYIKGNIIVGKNKGTEDNNGRMEHHTRENGQIIK